MEPRQRVFIDTNILLYLLVPEAGKTEKANDLLRDSTLNRWVSTQVLSEFAHVARKKTPLGWPDIRYYISTFQECCNVEPVIEADIETAINIAASYRYAWFDSLMIAAALRSGAEILFTEDLQHGQVIGPLVLRNPFIGAGGPSAH